MKNILIPILVLIFLVGAGIAEALIVNNIFEDFIAETDKLIELAKNEELTQEQFEAYDSMWYDVREKCEFFLPHSDVYELNLRVSETKGYVQNKDFESCLVQLEVVKRLAMYVRHLAEPKDKRDRKSKTPPPPRGAGGGGTFVVLPGNRKTNRAFFVFAPLRTICFQTLSESSQPLSSASDTFAERRLLGFQRADGHISCRTESVLPAPLPPDVKNGTTVFPSKS